MFIQRFETSATIGGFNSDEVAGMEQRVFPERNGLTIPKPLIEQASKIQRAFGAFLEQIHTTTSPALFCRRTVLDEAIMNLIMHGNRGNAELRSTVILTIEQQRTKTGQRLLCILSIDDHSPIYGAVPDPRDDKNLEEPSGRGILMMETYGVTITQNEHPGGDSKTVVYTWEEETKLPNDSQPESHDKGAASQ